MVLEPKQYPKWTSQYPSGVRWENIVYGALADGKNSTCDLITGTKEQGGRAYTPNDVEFEWSYNPNKESMFASGEVLTGLYFHMAWGKYPTSNMKFPYLIVFKGRAEGETDEVVAIITEYEIKEKYSDNNKQWLIQYRLSDYFEMEDIAHITIRAVFDQATGVGGKKSLPIQMNNVYLKIYHEKQEPIITIWDWVNHESFTTHDDFFWTISAKNTGNISGDCRYKLDLPSGCRLVSAIGDGLYDTDTQIYTSAIDSNKDSKITKRYKFMFDQFGTYTVKATNLDNPNNVLIHNLSVNKYYPKTSDNPNPYTKRDDIVETSIPQMIACSDGQYIDVYVQGFPQNLDGRSTASYHIIFTGGYSFDDPYVFMFRNIVEDSITWTPTSSNGGDLSFDLEDDSKTFAFTMNIPIQLCSLGDFAIWVTDTNGRTWRTNFTVNKIWRNKFITNPKVSHDKMYVRNTVNVGAESDVWTINLQSSKSNFFAEKDSELKISIEELQGYIGSVPIERCHKADVKANTSNSLIKTNYLNRKYLGKKGDYDEQIDMTLRLPWKDIATLQGLVAMDKPIPIDLIPQFLDGDPLNHRGWAEIYGIKNIHKINDMLYECDVEVDYLTHDILTNFKINQGELLTDKKLDYILMEAHDYGDNIVDRFYFNYSQFFSNLENTNGDLVGEYTIPPVAEFTMLDGEGLCKYSNYNMIWSNQLPMLKSMDHDGNWEMAVRIKDKQTKQVLFEHLYNNFKHYDFNEKKVLNTCDATTKVLDGNSYKVLNHTSMALRYKEEVDDEKNKILTYFNRIEDVEITGLDDKVEIFLLDKDNHQLANKNIIITISSTDGRYSEVYKAVTDLYGRATFGIPLNNGNYTVRFDFEGDDSYHSCHYEIAMAVTFDALTYHWGYDGVSTVTSLSDTYTATLYDQNDDEVIGYSVQYSFRASDSDFFSHEETLVTDANGQVHIPLQFVNGSAILRVVFKGFEEDGTVHQPCSFEDAVNINITGKVNTTIEADNFEMYQGELDKDYYVTLRDTNGNLLSNKDIQFNFANDTTNKKFVATTNAYGVASVPLYLVKGEYYAEILFKGDSTYAPCSSVKSITVTNFEAIDTEIIYDGGRGFKLQEVETQKAVPNMPIRFTIGQKYIDVFTDREGNLILPYYNQANVNLIAEFIGSTRYNGCEFRQDVKFKESTKAPLTITLEEVSGVLTPTFSDEDENEYDMDYDMLISYAPNPFQSYHYLDAKSNDINKYVLNHLNVGLYYVTIVFQGDRTFAPRTEIFELYNQTDNRETINTNYLEIDSLKLADGTIVDNPNSSIEFRKGDIVSFGIRFRDMINAYGHHRIALDSSTTRVGVQCYEGSSFTERASSTIGNRDIFPLIETVWVNAIVNGHMFKVTIDDNPYLKSIDKTFTFTNWSINPNVTDCDFTVTGFNGYTYNEVLLESGIGNEYGNIFDFAIVKVIDDVCNEEILFKAYMTNLGYKATTELDILLKKRGYSVEAMAYSVGDYANKLENVSTTITTDSEIEPPSSTIGNVDFSEIVVMPSSNDYDGSQYGSNIYFELRNNILNFIDYGMSRDMEDASGDIIVSDVELPMVDYDFEVSIKYNNSRYDNINDLTGKVQFNIWEDANTSTGATEYNNLVVSPTSLQKGITKYTRYTDEGTMYYVQLAKDETGYYICNPYIQYKGGTQLKTEGGWNIFNLDNNYSPVSVDNGLVKADFHRRTGYVVISRYDEIDKQFARVNVLKVPNSPKLSLVENYTDDSIELKFGETTWKLWRGRPFIRLEHPNTDIRIMNLVDRVYCETLENELGMGFIEESDAMYSIFNPQTTIQCFPHEYHIGESIKTDNFALKTVTATNRLYKLDDDVDMEISDLGSDKSIKITKNESCRIGLNFPSAPTYVEKPSNDFTLLLGQIKATGTDGTIVVKARGFDENGAIHSVDNLQLGIWESSHTETIAVDDTLDTIRVTFNDVPSEVVYVDFTIILPTEISTFEINHLMLYDGDSEINWERDTRKHNARTTEIRFNDTYYACLYDEHSECGLGIFRLGKESFSLRQLNKADETILVPYMKYAKEHDRVENIFFEYLNSKEQVIDIDWEN